MQILSIFIFFYASLCLIKCLFDKLSILDIENSVGIALQFRVVGHHHAGRAVSGAFTSRSNSVDTKNQIHYLNYFKT